MKKWCALTSVLLFVIGQVWSQTTISGKVVSVESGNPVDGANIRVDHSLAGCSTNAKGEFVLRNLPEGTHELRVTHVSYAPRSVTVKSGESQVVVQLENSYINIGQVVVTGTGTHRRMKDSPVPVSVITAQDIREANLSTMEEVLTKMNASFAFVTSGMGTTMSLNGLNDDYILVLENGRRLAGDDRISRINVANIKRVEILNGAASALYGTRSAEFLKCDFGRRRLVCQQVSNMGISRRLRFVYCEENDILGNSCNYISAEETVLKKMYILLNSSLLNWRFKVTSSNNHINNYEIDDLPVVDLNRVDENFTYSSQEELDRYVGELYGLTPEEINWIVR